VKRLSWANARTLVLLLGLPFVGVSVGVACLDYAGENLEICGPSRATTSTGGDADAGPADDCGTPKKPGSTGAGSGSGSAAPP
jgi:hypothetical protein